MCPEGDTCQAKTIPAGDLIPLLIEYCLEYRELNFDKNLLGDREESMSEGLAHTLLSIFRKRVIHLIDVEKVSPRRISSIMGVHAERTGDKDINLSYSQIHRIYQGKRIKVPPHEMVLVGRLRALGMELPEILRELTNDEEAADFLHYVTEHREHFRTWARAARSGKYSYMVASFWDALKKTMDEEEKKT